MKEWENKEVFIAANPTGPTEAVSINGEICAACNACANICRTQTIMPNPAPGKPPVVVFPDECWYCGSCVEACRTGALEMHLPINQRIFFKRKKTGEVFRIGQSDAPEKSFFKEPFGWREEG
ncbi:MAG: 4Fe-4S binding protein [Lachnospiraceae bacterium]|nr:4Fe-4S binding protein [Lachnospiraceae bacterium]